MNVQGMRGKTFVIGISMLLLSIQLSCSCPGSVYIAYLGPTLHRACMHTICTLIGIRFKCYVTINQLPTQGMALPVLHLAYTTDMSGAFLYACYCYANANATAAGLDWWTFEVIVMLSGLLPKPDQTMSMMGITFNVHALCFFAAHGLSGAASTRIGNDLGGVQG